MLTKVYQQLKFNSVCNNSHNFSLHFLNKSKSYYSVCATRNKKPSITVLLNLETNLLNTAKLYANNNYSYFIRTHRNLINLSKQVALYRKQLTCFSRLLKSQTV